MATISAGASAVVQLAAGTLLRGVGDGLAVIGAAGVVDPLSAGEGWQIGPFDRATSVSVTAFTQISYSVEEAGATGAASLDLRPAGTSIVLDGAADYAPLVISGATTIAVSGTTRGASAAMVVLADGANIPTITGADEWASSFGYLNTSGIPNRLDAWYDGFARRYAWSQQMVPAAIDVAAPTLSTAAVNGASLVLTYSEALNATAPAASAWSVVGAGGVTQTPSAVSISGSAVTLTLATPAVSGNTVTIGYTVPGTNPIRDTAGNSAAALSAQAVTNNTASGVQTETTAWLARVSSAGGTVGGTAQAAVDAFVVSAKAGGYWSKLSRINLFVGDAAASLVPLVNSAGGTTDTNTGTTYAESTGRVTNGTSQYLSTGLIPAAATGGLSVYLRTTQASDTTTRIAFGCRDSGTTQVFRIAANAASDGSVSAGAVSGIWGGTQGAGSTRAATTGGMIAAMWHVSRTGTTAEALYRNGASVATTSTSVTPGSAGVDLRLFASNPNGGAANAYLSAGSAIGAYAVDTGMTAGEAADFYADMQAFQTAMGRQV